MPVKYWMFPEGKSPLKVKLWNWSSNVVCGLAGVIAKVYLGKFYACHLTILSSTYNVHAYTCHHLTFTV